MSNIKIDKEQFTSSIEELEQASNQLSNAIRTLQISTNLARNGFTLVSEESVESYNSNVDNIFIAYEKMIGYKTQINSLVYYLKGIRTIIEEFEQEHANKDIDDLLKSVSDSNDLLQFLHFEENGDGNTLLYFDLEGKKMTISDMVNSFYTYTGTSMHANISGRIMSSKVGTVFDESTQKNLLTGVNGFISGTQDKGYFSILQEENFPPLEQNIGAVNTPFSYSNSERSHIGQMVASSVAVGASLIGAYTLSNHKQKEKKYKTREEVTSSIKEMIQDKIQNTSGRKR